MVLILADDLDGTTKNVKTVFFSLDGKDYEIDLSPEHAAALRKILRRYASHGRGTGAEPVPATANKLIRDWANANGRDIAQRGKIPAVIIDEFRAAHPNPA